MKNKGKLLTMLALSLTAVAGGAILTSCGGGDDISFKVNFYTDNDSKFATVEAVDGNIELPANPSKTGYVFTQWYKDAALTIPFDSTEKVTENLNIYAGWHKVPAAPSTLGYDKKKSEVYFTINDASYIYEMKLSRNGESVDTSSAEKVNNQYRFEVTLPGSYEFYVATKDADGFSAPNSKVVSFEIEEATFTVKFNDGTTTTPVELNADHTLTLPANPTKQDAKFEGWYLDETYRTELDVSNVVSQLGFNLDSFEDQTVTVYAKWSYKPEAPVAPSVTYTNAKASGVQKLTIIDTKNTENVKGYSLTIVDSNGSVVDGYNNLEVLAANKVVELDSSKFNQGETYLVYIKTVSTLTWNEENVTSQEKEVSFTYSIVPQDVYTIHYMDGATSIRDVNHTEGSEVVLPSTPIKTGYTFVRWELNGEEFTTSTEVKSTITVQAVFKKNPTAPVANYLTAKVGQDQFIQWTDSTDDVKEYKVVIKNQEGLIIQENITSSKSITLDGSYLVDETYEVSIVTVLNEMFDGEYIESAPTTTLFRYSETALDKVEVKFIADSSLVSNIFVDEGTSVTTLPANPTKPGYKFSKWVIEGTSTEFTTSTVVDSSINVVAVFDEDPISPEVTFNPAKANANPTLTWEEALGNVDHYVIVVKQAGSGTIIESFEVSTLSVTLDRTLYTAGSTYTVETKTVLVSGKTSLVSGTAIEYSVKPYDTFNAYFYLDSEDTEAWDTKSVKEQGTITVPSVNPTKKGYIFSNWTLADGSDIATAEITGDVNCVAVWTKLPDAPTAVTYTDSTLTISWAEVAGATEYQYSIDGNKFKKTTSTSVQEFGLTLGEHEIVLRVVCGDLTSEDSIITFNVETLYVAKMYNGQIIGTVAVVDKKIPSQGAPASMPTTDTFIKWNYDGKVGSTAINFESDEFEETQVIYAITRVTPVGVLAGSIIYDEDTDTISWDKVEDASYYRVTFKEGSTAFRVNAEDASFVANINNPGSYYIKIETWVNTETGTIKATTTTVEALNITLTSKTEYNADGSLIKVVAGDKTTYIYFAGQHYVLSGATFATSEAYEKLGDNHIVMTTDSELLNVEQEMIFVDSNGNTQTRLFKVVPQVTGLNIAGGYANYLVKTSESSTTFMNKENTYKLGTDKDTNNFVLDLDITYGTGMLFNTSDVAFDVEFKINGVITNDVSLVKSNDKYVVKFAREYTSGTLEMTVSPRYVNKDNYDAVNQKVKSSMVKTYSFELNDGVNVYTNAQLKEAVADLSVSKINVLNGTIVAELDADQLNADGSPVNFADRQKLTQDYTGGAMNTSGDSASSIINTGVKKAGDVYLRYMQNVDGNHFEVNGNYATIDGSKLPLIDGANAERGYYSDQAGYVDRSVTGHVQKAYIGIFSVVNKTAEKETTAQLNDLEIIANSGNRGSDQIEITKWSGGYNAVQGYLATISGENLNIRGADIGIYFTTKTNKNNYAVFNHTSVADSWANAYYCFGTTHTTFLNSFLGDSSGAAIHMEDVSEDRYCTNPVALYDLTPLEDRHSEIRKDPGVTIDSNTIIENWTDGTGPYFVAYGFGTSVPMMKGGIEPAVNNFGKTILKSYEGGVTKINLAILGFCYTDASAFEITRIQKDGTRINVAYTGSHTSDNNKSSYDCAKDYPHLTPTDLTNVSAMRYIDSAIISGGQVLMPHSAGAMQAGNAVLKSIGTYVGTVLQTGSQSNADAYLAANGVALALNDYDKAILTGAAQMLAGTTQTTNMTVITNVATNLTMAYAYQLLGGMVDPETPEGAQLLAALPLSSYPMFAAADCNQQFYNVLLDGSSLGASSETNSCFLAMLEYKDLA